MSDSKEYLTAKRGAHRGSLVVDWDAEFLGPSRDGSALEFTPPRFRKDECVLYEGYQLWLR